MLQLLVLDFIEIYKLVKEEASGEDTKLTVWGPAHAYTELAVFDRLAGPGQVYETNEDLKKGLIQAYKEFLDDYKAAGGHYEIGRASCRERV